MKLLNEKELKVAELVALGLTTKEIAKVLTLSKHTVNEYIRHGCYKLQLQRVSRSAFAVCSLGVDGAFKPDRWAAYWESAKQYEIVPDFVKIR